MGSFKDKLVCCGFFNFGVVFLANFVLVIFVMMYANHAAYRASDTEDTDITADLFKYLPIEVSRVRAS